MQLTGNRTICLAGIVLASMTALTGCSTVSFQPGQPLPTVAAMTAVRPSIVPITNVVPRQGATSACSAILDNIPDTVVKSGKPTLAAAYEVTGAQLAAYEETFFDQIMSEWSDHPTDVVDVCIFDGDFDTMTPGPSGHDTSATRVLVVISAGRPELWAITRNKPGIPTTNPATIVSGPTASPAP
jgi:hypothetical protein